jgi:ketosteroid isomerase-like protein
MNRRDVVTGLLDALAAHDRDAVTARLAGHVTVSIPATGVDGGPRVETEEFFTDLLRAFPDLRVTVKRMVVTDDAVTVEVKVEGTQADEYLGAINQEKHLDIDEVWRLTVTDGLVTSLDAYWCQQQLYRRLGVKRFDQIALV